MILSAGKAIATHARHLQELQRRANDGTTSPRSASPVQGCFQNAHIGIGVTHRLKRTVSRFLGVTKPEPPATDNGPPCRPPPHGSHLCEKVS